MKKFAKSCLLGSALIAATSFTVPSYADDAGAFVGGMLTSRVLGNMQARTQAEQQQAAAAQQQANNASYSAVPQAAPAPQEKSVEQRMKELDSLAAAGYISKEEYQAKKQAILNSI